ncbi:MAG: formyltransferase [Steroidobacteraceae bacterium]
MSIRAVVFAHHDVGMRCLLALRSAGVDVPLVFAHEADPGEEQWYGSVIELARALDIPVVTPRNPNSDDWVRLISGHAPDFIFSFYYRSLIATPVLQLARLGALNMHGSLLPDYRGRAPVNWAILHGEAWTGATLHYMVQRADGGDIVDQQAVPILEDDDACVVFGKVTVAAEIVLARSLPHLIAGTAARRPQDPRAGQYFGRRRPEDGRIDWSWPAARIHNLVRAVAPPFPAAFGEVGGATWWIHRTRRMPNRPQVAGEPCLFAEHGKVLASCGDGSCLEILAGRTIAGAIDIPQLARDLAAMPLRLIARKAG